MVMKLALPVLHPLRISLGWENPIILIFTSLLEAFNLYMFALHSKMGDVWSAFRLNWLQKAGLSL